MAEPRGSDERRAVPGRQKDAHCVISAGRCIYRGAFHHGNSLLPFVQRRKAESSVGLAAAVHVGCTELWQKPDLRKNSVISLPKNKHSHS